MQDSSFHSYRLLDTYSQMRPPVIKQAARTDEYRRENLISVSLYFWKLPQLLYAYVLILL